MSFTSVFDCVKMFDALLLMCCVSLPISMPMPIELSSRRLDNRSNSYFSWFDVWRRHKKQKKIVKNLMRQYSLAEVVRCHCVSFPIQSTVADANRFERKKPNRLVDAHFIFVRLIDTNRRQRRHSR